MFPCGYIVTHVVAERQRHAPSPPEPPAPASLPAAVTPPSATPPSPPLQVAALTRPEPPSALRPDAAPAPSGKAPPTTLAVVAPPAILRPIDPREAVEAALKGLECARVSADIDAGSGTVTLKGHARSEADRLRLSTEIASVAGVQKIDDSGLRVLGDADRLRVLDSTGVVVPGTDRVVVHVAAPLDLPALGYTVPDSQDSPPPMLVLSIFLSTVTVRQSRAPVPRSWADTTASESMA